MQDWAKEHGIEWRLHLPYTLQAAGLVERKNRIVKQQVTLLTSKTALAGWTKVPSQALLLLNDLPVGPLLCVPDWGLLLRYSVS